MREICLVLLFLMALGQGSLFAQLAPPRIGYVSDSTGAFRPVLGVSGNFLLGEPLADSVVSAGFSGTFSFFKTDTTLSIVDGAVKTDFPSSAGPAIFSFSGHAGFVYSFSGRTLQRWDGANLADVPLDFFPGDVLALAQPDLNRVWLAVRQSDAQVYLLLFDGVTGTLQSSAPLTGASGNLALLNDQEFLYGNASGLVLHRDSGIEITLSASLVGDVHFERIGALWWSVRDDAGQHFAVRTEPGREGVFQLPENTQ